MKKPRLTPKPALETITLSHGGHRRRQDGVCLLEAVAWIAGEPHSDHPVCVCPVIARFGRTWNDSLPTDEDRNRLLRPLIPFMIGTASTKEAELQRAYLALDWLIRIHVPAWMQLPHSLKAHVERLRNLPEIRDAASFALAQDPLIEARKAAAAAWEAAWDAATAAAWGAAWDAATAAAGDAAGDAARAAAWTAAGAAAGDAAGDAARAAAWDAARAAVRAAAGDAAGDAATAAAWDALKPTVSTLQDSAMDLMRRMMAVKAA